MRPRGRAQPMKNRANLLFGRLFLPAKQQVRALPCGGARF